jgi:hypothetical protein
MEFAEIKQNGFTIFSKSGCHNCTKLKKILIEKQLLFIEIQCDEYLIDDTKSYDHNFHVKPILEDNNLIFCSEFPHGYSLKQGRLMYYYGKHIFYNI